MGGRMGRKRGRGVRERWCSRWGMMRIGEVTTLFVVGWVRRGKRQDARA
jgi:hypothetical protein